MTDQPEHKSMLRGFAPTTWTAGQPGRDAYGFMTRAIA
jgi:hypothetical protein